MTQNSYYHKSNSITIFVKKLFSSNHRRIQNEKCQYPVFDYTMMYRYWSVNLVKINKNGFINQHTFKIQNLH